MAGHHTRARSSDSDAHDPYRVKPNLNTLSLGYLTFAGLSPPEIVGLAADVGFDHVGLRLKPISRTERQWPVLGATRMASDLRRTLRATGVAVLDVEVLRLTPSVDIAAMAPVLEAAADLGARFVVVNGFDPDVDRISETFAELCELSGPLGLRPMLEPIAYSSVGSLAAAARIVELARSSHGGVLVDALHLARTGGRPADVDTLRPEWLGYLHLCDGPAQSPCGGMDAIRRESREDRLPPGQGALPLVELLDRMPADIPVSVEAPSHRLRHQLGDRRFAALVRSTAQDALDRKNDTGSRIPSQLD